MSYSNISHVSGSEGRGSPQVVRETPQARRTENEATSQIRPWSLRRNTNELPQIRNNINQLLSSQSNKSELTKNSVSKSKRSRKSNSHSKSSKKSSKTPIKRAKNK